MSTNMLKRLAVATYRKLPMDQAARRKLKAAVLTPMLQGKTVSEFDWRGMKIWIDPAQSMDVRLQWDGDYEPETMAAIQKLVRPGSEVIDVGANIGLVSMWIRQCLGDGGRVIGIEPSIWACDRMRRNLALSQMTGIDIVCGGAAAETGSVEMRVLNGYRVDDVDTSSLQQVELVTVDQVVEEKGLKNLSLIKVDTDGYEVGVFKGATKTLATMKPDILFEFSPDHAKDAGYSVSEVIDILRGHGYVFFNEQFEAVVDPLAITLGDHETTNLIAKPSC